jgi:hypothetical protein
MSVPLLLALNAFFLVFHTGLVFFNTFGWMHPRTRRANLATLLLTLFSWTIMGLKYGVGYCVCTDWHWQVRHALGIKDNADSYVEFLVESLTPYRPNTALVHNATAAIFMLSLTISLYLNARDGTIHAPRLRLRS